MKRSTVVRLLQELADDATRLAALDASDDFEMPPLVEVWVGGDLLEKVADVEHVVAILMFDVPADELPEMALHRAELALHDWLRVGKRPMIWRSRPQSRPAWSHLERRVARVWSREAGPEAASMIGLVEPGLPGVDVVAPTDGELTDWLHSEIPRSDGHLRSVLDRYWQGSWRREHTGGGIHPDDHLWRAAWAVQSMRDALAELA